MNKYFQELNRLPQSTTLTKMRELALNQKVPIIDDEGLVFLLFLVKTKKVRRILEIGTAIGFSAINMAMISREIFIETLEKDKSLSLGEKAERAQQLLKNSPELAAAYDPDRK